MAGQVPQNSQKSASKRAGQGSKMVNEITHFKIESRGAGQVPQKAAKWPGEY